MKLNKLLLPLLLVAVIALAVGVFYLKSHSTHVGFVRLDLLMDKYKGVKESKEVLEKKLSEWQSNLDTLQKRYEASAAKFEVDKKNLNIVDLQKMEAKLNQQYTMITKYANDLEKLAQEENGKLNKGLMFRLDAFLKKYAKENGYDIILTISPNNYMVAGDASADLTENVIVGLNKE